MDTGLLRTAKYGKVLFFCATTALWSSSPDLFPASAKSGNALHSYIKFLFWWNNVIRLICCMKVMVWPCFACHALLHGSYNLNVLHVMLCCMEGMVLPLLCVFGSIGWKLCSCHILHGMLCRMEAMIVSGFALYAKLNGSYGPPEFCKAFSNNRIYGLAMLCMSYALLHESYSLIMLCMSCSAAWKLWSCHALHVICSSAWKLQYHHALYVMLCCMEVMILPCYASHMEVMVLSCFVCHALLHGSCDLAMLCMSYGSYGLACFACHALLHGSNGLAMLCMPYGSYGLGMLCLSCPAAWKLWCCNALHVIWKLWSCHA